MTVQAGRYEAMLLLATQPNEPIADQEVNVYAVGTTTHASVYTDHIAGTAAANPVLTDPLGNLEFFAVPGDYDVEFVWGNVTIRHTVTVRNDPANGAGFNGASPQAKAAAYTQTSATPGRTVAAATAVAVDTTGSSQTTPYGFTSSAQADAIPVAINALETDVATLRGLINALIDDSQAIGIAG